jgi:hypothetical protein
VVETSGQAIKDGELYADRKHRYTLLEATDPVLPNNHQQHTQWKTEPQNLYGTNNMQITNPRRFEGTSSANQFH